MTTPTLTTMEELVCDQCDEFIRNGKPFSAVAITEALKTKELKNPTNGVDIRHRHVNDLVRNYMAQIANSANYATTLTNPTIDENGRPINAPDGVYVYHPHSFDADVYRHPPLTKPLSLQGVPVTPPAKAPSAPVLPLVSVRYTMTDDNPKNEDTHIFRATFSKKETTEKDVYDAIMKKIEEKILDSSGFGLAENDENEDYFDLSLSDPDDEPNVPIVIHLKYNDENDKTQEKTFTTLDEFDKAYGFQRWQELEEEDELTNLVSILPTNNGFSRCSNLPDLHLPIYADGRVGIPASVVKNLINDAIVLRAGDVPNTVKFIELKNYLSTQD